MAKENPISNLASEPLLGNHEIGQNSTNGYSATKKIIISSRFGQLFSYY